MRSVIHRHTHKRTSYVRTVQFHARVPMHTHGSGLIRVRLLIHASTETCVRSTLAAVEYEHSVRNSGDRLQGWHGYSSVCILLRLLAIIMLPRFSSIKRRRSCSSLQDHGIWIYYFRVFGTNVLRLNWAALALHCNRYGIRTVDCEKMIN